MECTPLPKSGKSWLALEMAVSVATGSKCLGKYPVREPGPTLVYLAEDSLAMLRDRLSSLSKHHGAELSSLEVHVITAQAIRLDLGRDQVRLQKTIRERKPRMLVLDPLVRLHRCDENSAQEVSGLLSYLRDLQREFDLAVVLVHHTRKNNTQAQAGQGLRGSSDFYAWCDSGLYLKRFHGELALTVEHRAAAAPEPIGLRLASTAQDDAPHLEITELPPATTEGQRDGRPLDVRVLQALEGRGALRDMLGVKNERLGPTLARLERERRIQRESDGWHFAVLPSSESTVPCSLPRVKGNGTMSRDPQPNKETNREGTTL
jgi:hypothetical protein